MAYYSYDGQRFGWDLADLQAYFLYFPENYTVNFPLGGNSLAQGFPSARKIRSGASYARFSMNAVEIEAALSELAQQPFAAVEFPFAFLAAFGNKDTTLKRLRTGNNNASDVPDGVLQRNNIHIATSEAGTAGETLKALRASPATAKAKAKFILATDGLTLEAEELVSGETIACTYPNFPDHFGFFLPLAGISTIKEIKDNPIDVRATGRLNKLYVELLRENPDWATAERRHDMNHFMARLIFCFFAEDTDIFNGEGLFTRTVEQMSERDGSNTHHVLSVIFRAMNIKLNERDNAQPRLPKWADGFPYVNGGLFSGSAEVPRFTRIARTYLLHAGRLKWREINPDIFGSMIQAVADDEERGALGMHYTSVPNILKVLNPLFLDGLRAQLAEAGDNKIKLLNLRKRMARIRVFDPACGSGNFLVIAYKQMREIEAEINRRRGEAHLGSEIPLTNFRGIELRDFPAEIARLALIIAEFQCDVLYRGQKDALEEFLPLDAQNWIVRGNALQLDWLSICPPTGTASGKSRALMFIALDKLNNQGLKQAIVVVPERSIGGSFADEPLSQNGFYWNWQVAPQWNLCNAPGADEPRVAKSKVEAVRKFLESTDQVLICTHATFRFSVDELGIEAFDNRLIAVDEFHHVSSNPDNKLGGQLGAFIARDKVHLVAMTGSYFRGDSEAVLAPADEARFETVTYTYYEQLNGYQWLKSLDIGYFFYTGRYVDAVTKVLDPALKTIVHIPNVNARESLKDKHREVDDIMHGMGEWKGVDPATGFHLVQTKDGRTLKVADLVDDSDPAGRSRVLTALKDPVQKENRNHVDVIIALGMAKEGFDWIWCEHALTIGYRSSLTEIVQIIGRATRDAQGKLILRQLTF